MLTSIKIEKLFDIFDYDIEFKKEGITILTGPNGYGKTTILKILDALASQNMLFFDWLLFKKITVEFSRYKVITFEKNDIGIIINNITEENKILWNYSSFKKDLPQNIPYFDQVGENEWVDTRTDDFYSSEELTKKILKDLPIFSNELREQISTVYFIREQRLLRPIADIYHNRFYPAPAEELDNHFKKTIEEYAEELKDIAKNSLAESSQIAQKLDSSFPRRLFDQEEGISEDEFSQRFGKVKEIQKSLNQYGLSDIKEDDHPTYKPENAKALNVYINDTEGKLAVFRELLEKLKVFTDILNERRFTFKKIIISKDEGFKLISQQGKPLALSDLSSGEQHEVVLLYELLFKVKPGTLVLIDEPELSLHVVWQKQFLDDLFKIIELQKINVVVATHSPQIINNRWDLEVDLEELRDASVSK